MLTRRGLGRLFGSAVLTAGLSGSAWAAEARPVSGGALTFAVESEPTTLNPHLNGQAKARVILRNLFDSLLARDPEGGFLPWLAESWESSADGLVHDFTLRPGVRFHNGEALDAAAVALNFERLRDPAYSASHSAGPVSRLVRAEVVAPLKLRLTLSEPYAPFLGFAAGLEILAPAAFASAQLKAGGAEVAGSGPFILEAYAKGQEIRLKRNPDYAWAPANAAHQGPAHLERATFRFLGESAVRIGALLSNQVDVVEGVPGDEAARLQDDPAFQYAKALNSGTPCTLFLNARREPTSDLRLRKALLAAVDLDAALASIYRGQRQRAWGISAPIERDFYDAAIEGAFAFDPAEANRLLDEAGWTARDAQGYRPKEGRRLAVEVVQSQATVRDQRDVLLLAIQAQARQNAGIFVDLQYVDLGAYAERRKAGDYGSIPNGLGVTPYSPLARGVLTGKYRPGAAPAPETRAGRGDKRIAETEWRPESLEIARKIAERAEAKGVTAAEFALAWVLNNRFVTSTIAGPRTEEQWDGYVRALEAKIDAADEAFVDGLVAPGHASTHGFTDPAHPVEGRAV